MINMKDLIKQQTNLIRKESGMKLNEGGEKTYKTLLKVEKEINELERTFKREKKGMSHDRAKNVEKSIVMMKRAWTSIWADFQGR